MAGALLVKCSDHRSFDVYAPDVIGVADREGSIVLDPLSLNTLDAWSVLSRGFRPFALAPSALADGREDVVLNAGHVHDVVCLDLDGAPVGGVRVYLSSAQMPSHGLPSPERAHVGCGADAIHCAVTDEAGRASLSGLPAGEFSIRALHETATLVARKPRPLRVPGPATTLTFGGLIAGVFDVGADDPVGFGWTILGPSVIGLPQNDVQVVTARLEQRFEGSIVLVAARTAPGQAATANLRLLGRATGLRSLDVELEPYREDIRPRRLSLEGDGTPCVPFSFEVADAGGRPLPVRSYAVQVGKDFFSGIRVELAPNAVNHLPGGSYELEQGNPWLGAAAMSPGTFVVPGGCSVRLAELFGHCRFEVRDPEEQAMPAYTLVLKAKGSTATYRMVESSHSVWLPVGEAEYAVTLAGYGTKQGTFLVADADPAGTPQPVVIRF